MSGYLNEEYDDWYNGDEDEFNFDDPEGIGTTIEEACKFVQTKEKYIVKLETENAKLRKEINQLRAMIYEKK